MEYKSARRYYLFMRLGARSTQDQLECTWRSKQEEQPGTALPDDVLFLPQLAEAGYTTLEDLDGADVEELRRTAGLQRTEAEAVLAQVATLALLALAPLAGLLLSPPPEEDQ